MARKSLGGSNGRNFGQDLNRGQKTIWIAALIIAAVGAAVAGIRIHKRATSKLTAPQTVNTPAVRPMRASPEALEVLSQLRNRYCSVSQRQTNSDPGTTEPSSALSQSVSPLLPGLTDDFEANPAGILARFPTASGKSEAKVVLPSRANAAFELQAMGTGMRVQAQLEDVQDKAAEMADGYAVYRQALGPNTTVLRRAMPNGSEDFVSFTEAPKDPSVSYRMTLDASVAGLRLVSNTLELLDSNGTPRLRVAPPYIVSADGNWVAAKLALNGCAADSDPSDPAGRALTAPGSQSCQLRVTWDNDAVEYPALLDPTWMTTGSMASARQGHTATLLSTGKVLVAGGTNGSTALATAELYDRTTGTWAATGSMTGARQWHTAVQLNTSSNPTASGKILIAGGRNGTTSLNTAQLYSPSAGTWMAAGALNAAREQHTATLLPSGKVLVTGGINGTTVLATAATYDPSSSAGTWTATTSPMPGARKSHTATLISTTNTQLNGKVLVVGGNDGTASQPTVYLYDPAQLQFSTLTAIPSAREGQTATALSNLRILHAGGRNGATTLNTAIVFDPATGAGNWFAVGNLTVARQGHSASLLSNGQVLVAGGSNGTTALNSAELYSGPAGWAATTVMPAAVQAHTATALDNNIVLIAGGLNSAAVQSAASLYDVTGGNTCTNNSQCSSGNCISGVCCNTACTDQCYSCNLPGLVGICSPLANGTTCNDNNACTTGDACQAGNCAPGSAVPVDDNNPCTADACDSVNGVTHTPVATGTSCSDGNVCNGNETCNGSGVCIAGTAPVINDNNPCTADACDPVNGVTHTPVAAGTTCTDGNICTGAGTCNATGTCMPGTIPALDDGNPCTADACDPVNGVTHTPVAAGTSCADNNLCNGNEVCNASAVCIAGTPPPTNDNNPCTTDSCDPVAGVTHVAVAAGTSCSDGNACNGNEICNATGACTAGTAVVCTASDVCHVPGTCEPSTGACSNPAAPNGTACNDNNACTAGDACQAGNCTPGSPVAVDDGNPCTTDACSPSTGVSHTPVAAGTSCSDGNACNGNEICNATGACTAGTAVVCTASDVCHIAGTCEPSTGACSNPAATNGTACNDNNACTAGDACQDGACIPGSAVAVDDGNPCTSDSCDPVAGVTHTPAAAGTSCADANVCNGSETCNGSGVCIAGTAPAIDDNNPCTTDSCDPATGIAHTPVAAGTSCSDGNACNGSESCNAAGSCAPGTPPALDDGNPCTADVCDSSTGAITHNLVPAGTACTSNDVCNSGQTCTAQGQCQGGTPANVDDGDPTTIDTCVPGQGVKHRKAAAIDKTVITTTLSANQWLYTGTDPIQTGVAPGTIELRRAAVVHGYVKDRQGQPIPSVAITILNHPEFGATVTHADGRYDMVVNGGGQLTVKYTKSDLLEAQRAVNAPWDDHTWATDVVMIPSDPAVTPIDLTSSADFQVAQGSIINDSDGERQATILFPVDNVATMTLPDGSTQTIPTLHVRATEFTVGDSGPAAMPADLPPTTAYTYAVEINADEAVAAGAKSVKFDKALPLYVNNFLGFSPGTTVPMGSYSRERAQWVPEDSGVVVAVLDNSGGNVQLDITGTGVPATTEQLAAIGITDAERVQLAGLYVTGQSFWRVQVKHFTSPIDLNWPTTPPSPPPVPPAPPGGPNGGCGSTCCGSGSGSGPGGPTASGSSVLKCGERVYSETIPVPGTTFNLVYESDRVLGYRKPGTLSIPLIGSEFDKNVLKIYVGVRVGGRDVQLNFMPNAALNQDFNLVRQLGDQIAYEFKPSPYLAYEFNWDGNDLDYRLEVGPQKATVTVGYFYDSPYWLIDRFGNPVETAQATIGNVLARQPTLQWWRNETQFNVGPWDARSVGLGGWTLDVHHTYDARTKQVQFGNGGHSPGAASSTTMQRAGGQCNDTSDTGDNVPAVNASMSVNWRNISTGPDGSVYISEGNTDPLGSRVRKISPSGIITTIAGGNAPVTPGGSITNSLGDGGLAKNASFTLVADVAVAKDGSLYVADYYNHRIRRIDPNGIIATIAGNGSEGNTGDGGPATEAAIGEVSGLALGPDGSLFFIAHDDHFVRRITPDGIVHAYAGGGTGNDDEVPATSTALYPESIDVASDGSLYVAGGGAYNTGRLRRVTTDGIIHHVKGIGPGGLQWGPGGYIYPISVAIGPGDSVYAATSGGGIYLMKDDKAIPVVGGTDAVVHNCSENDPPRAVAVGNTAIAMSPASELYFGLQARLMKVSSSYPGLQLGSTGSAYVLPDAANNQVYEFDANGRHQLTRNMTTGANIYAFGYDSTGLLTSVTHDNGKQTVIQRDANGVAQAIVGPYGQTTQLTNYDANGYVGAVTDPLGNSSQIVYSTSTDSMGLVTSFTNNRGFASTVTYNPDGTVIKDQDSLGGFKSLTLVDKTPTTSDIELQTALGVSTFYHFEQYPDGGKRDLVTWPDATTTISERLASEVSNITQPDGTVIKVTRGPDPLWGMNLPTVTTTTTLPSGLARTQATSRNAAASNSDLAALTAETTYQTINGRTTTTTFDPTNKRYITSTPAGRSTTRYVDTTLRTTKIQRPNIADLIFAYDADNRLSTITQGTRITHRTYYDSGDINGYLQTLTNPLSQTTTFVPDALGRTLQQTLDAATTQFSWDETSNLTSVTPPGKPTHVQTYTARDLLQDYIPPAAGLNSFATNYQYNLDKQLLTETRPDTVQTSRSYDPAGRLDLMTMPTGALGYTYYPAGCTTTSCAAGKLASIAGPGNESLAFTYDGQLQTSATWSGLVNGSVAWTYDTDFRKVTETVQAGSTSTTAAFGYDADSLLTCASPTTCPSGAGALTISRNSQNALLTSTSLGNVTDAYTYNGYGELATYQAKYGTNTLYSVTYDATGAARDALGRVVQKTETLQGTTHVFGYTYDVQGRLTDVSRDGTLIEHYGYDLNSNRTTATVGGTTVNPTYDEQDRLLTYGGTTFTYTANGELRTKTDASGTTTYTYDAVGSLIAVNLPDGRLIEYVTDGKGRRVGKMVNGVLVKQWLYRDQLKPVAELDGSGNLVSEFIYGTKSNVPDLVVRGGVTYRVVSDQLGSPVLAVNTTDSSDIAFQATYAAFGERTLIAGTDDWMPFGFAGGQYDPDTKLIRFGRRDYGSAIGRWVSKDPIRFASGQWNIYVYVHNDPVNSRDPAGMSSAAECEQTCGDIAFEFEKQCPLMCAQSSNSPEQFGDCVDSCHQQALSKGGQCINICDTPPDDKRVHCEGDSCLACSGNFGTNGG